MIGRAWRIHRRPAASNANSMSCGAPRACSIRRPDRGELQHLGIAEDGRASPDDVLVDRTRIGVDRVVVGIDRARHDGVAQPCGRVDDRSTPSTGDRVGGEQHAGRRGVDHALDDHGRGQCRRRRTHGHGDRQRRARSTGTPNIGGSHRGPARRPRRRGMCPVGRRTMPPAGPQPWPMTGPRRVRCRGLGRPRALRSPPPAGGRPCAAARRPPQAGWRRPQPSRRPHGRRRSSGRSRRARESRSRSARRGWRPSRQRSRDRMRGPPRAVARSASGSSDHAMSAGRQGVAGEQRRLSRSVGDKDGTF